MQWPPVNAPSSEPDRFAHAVARMVGVDEEHRRAAVGLGDADRERRAERSGDEPLGAVDHVVRPVAARGGAQHRGVGTGAGRRFGHRDHRAHVARGERAQVAFLLRVVRDDFEQVHVALVGRRDVERRRAEQAVSGGLEDRRSSPVIEPQAPVLAADVRHEDAGRFRLGTQIGDQPGRRLAAVLAELVLARDHLVANERAHPRDHFGDAGLGGTVDCRHGRIPRKLRGKSDTPVLFPQPSVRTSTRSVLAGRPN